MALRDKIAHFFLRYLAVPKTPKIIPGKTHIACIGDSITFGAGVNGKTEQTWEYCLGQKLGDLQDFPVHAIDRQDSADLAE